MTKAEVLKEAEGVFGFVPGFIKESPEYEVEAMWGLFRDLVVRDSAIPRKYKLLIQIGVGAVLHDQYRLYADTEQAKAHGASPDEIREAVAIVGEMALFSTWLNGYNFDLDTFKREVLAMLEGMKRLKALPARGRLETREEIYRDAEAIFGLVPGFIREVPDVALRHLYRFFRGVELEQTLIPDKYKVLISLAAASVIPCRYCILADTEFARLVGASDGEIKEAILLAGRVRNFGTMIYGTQYDLETFKKEMRGIAEALKK